MSYVQNEPVVIYGAGGNGRLVYDALKREHVDVLYFIDLYTKETSYDGVSIYRPDNTPYKGEKVLISVSCTSESIKQDLSKFNINNCLNMNEIIQAYPSVHDVFMPEAYTQELRDSVVSDKEQLTQFATLLDDSSMKCLDRILAYRTNPSAQTYVENDWEIQYFPDWLLDLNLWSDCGFRMIDCGAYTGDTLFTAKKVLDKKNVKSQHYVCFEPDKQNYQVMQEQLLKQTFNEHYSVQFYPSGVWKESSLLHFNAGDSQGKIDPNSTSGTTIPVTSLDESCFGFAPNFIKMDIEGSEPEAIEGAKEIIKTYTPTLAISVYHEPKHLWSIAEQILTINPNYTFKLHVHGDFGLEIILYAVPN